MPRQACLIAASAQALSAPILILGAPRSGTTWLAKIIDSHPDVLYRHEPDRTLPSPPLLNDEALPGLLASWAADTGPRTVTKRPFFRKSWQPAWAGLVRAAYATAISASARLPKPLSALGDLRVPDLASREAPRLALKSIEWAAGAGVLARTLPDSRTIFILRHPCGQVTSMIRGHRQLRFELRTKGTEMPFDEVRTIRFAASFGVGERAFKGMSDAAKFAWSWRSFNEPTYAALANRPNVQVVLYEALCADPAGLARQILAFAGLDWNRQTSDFVERSSTHKGRSGYYAVFRNAAAAAEAWRTSMSPDELEAVRSVVAGSPLARFWPDLDETGGTAKRDGEVTTSRESARLPP